MTENDPPRDRLSGTCDLELLIDLGEVPIGGIYWPRGSGKVRRAPLRLAVGRSSGLVQVMDRYDPSLYADYTFSGTSSRTYERHIADVAEWFCAEGNPSALFEIGASDGVLLAIMRDRGCVVDGIEPSSALVEAAMTARGVSIRQGYMSKQYAAEVLSVSERYSAVVMRHVLEHLDAPHDMFEAIDVLVAQNGRLLLELPSLEEMMKQDLYSNVFHEHVAYYSQSVLWDLLAKHGWGVVRYRRVDIHGGSHLLECRRGAHAVAAPAPDPDALARFVAGFQRYCERVRTLVSGEVAAGRRIAIWGASHRTALLMALSGLDSAPVSAVYDRNRMLHG
ncbi:MAG TPA: methyltransferase domain-containing protein, partial [Microvirga sp.]|nr:methyltransferase domain-containing protein [Microvirga sp.]